MIELKEFKNKCLNQKQHLEDISEEWGNLRLAQHRYGCSFTPIYKLFKGHFCPNCETKLEESKCFAGKTYMQPFYHKRYILICNECDYKFAFESRW